MRSHEADLSKGDLKPPAAPGSLKKLGVSAYLWLPEDDGHTLGQWFVDREHVAQLRIDTQQNPGFGADDESEEREEFLARGWIGLSPLTCDGIPTQWGVACARTGASGSV